MNKYLIALDDGHGMETPGKRTPPIPELGGRVIRENEFNRAVVNFLDKELKRCGFDTLLVAPGDSDVPLRTRTNLANSKNANAYICIHYNAFDGKFGNNDPEGISVHIYTKTTMSEPLAKAIHKYLIRGTKQKDRGIVRSNFHVLRETKMPAVLTENGFMDNKREAMLMINIDFQKEVAREHAQGICEYFGVKYIAETEETSNDTLYRVQAGAFKNRTNADNLIAQLKAEGFETYLFEADGLYKIQVGAYSKKENADTVEKELKEKGFSSYITSKSGSLIYASPTSSNIINVGSKVKVKSGAKTYDGKGLASFVYEQIYDVIQIDGNRIVIGKGKAVTAAVNKSDLMLM